MQNVSKQGSLLPNKIPGCVGKRAGRGSDMSNKTIVREIDLSVGKSDYTAVLYAGQTTYTIFNNDYDVVGHVPSEWDETVLTV